MLKESRRNHKCQESNLHLTKTKQPHCILTLFQDLTLSVQRLEEWMQRGRRRWIDWLRCSLGLESMEGPSHEKHCSRSMSSYICKNGQSIGTHTHTKQPSFQTNLKLQTFIFENVFLRCRRLQRLTRRFPKENKTDMNS